MKSFHRSIAFLSCAVFLCLHGHAQQTPAPKSWELGLAYWGTLSQNYGVKASAGRMHPLSERYALHTNLSIIVNRKADVYTTLGITLENYIRRTGAWGGYFEHGINIGNLSSRYDFDIYGTNAQGQVVNLGQRWLNGIMFGYALGLGYDFSKKTPADFQVFFRPGLYYRAPNYDNTFYINHFSVEAGVFWQPKFMNRKRE